MSNEKMFEIAVRTKMRFPFRGLISVEDLWDLSVENLDTIFKTLNSELKQVKEESLLEVKTKEDEELDIKIQIVKYIVQTKLTEAQSRADSKKKKEQKQKIFELISSKKDEDLKNKSVKELEKMLETLED